MKEIKNNLRNKFIIDRNNIDTRIRERIDKKIIYNIIESKEYIAASNIFTFVGIGSEVSTIPLIEKSLKDGKNVFVPLCIKKPIMEARRIKSLSELKENRLGLLEPSEESEMIEIDDIDLSIVPCLSADREGYRLGYGGGFYDRYFSLSNWSNAIIVCREDFIVDKLPRNHHDVKFNKIMSENGIIVI